MTATPPVILPSSILPLPSSHCAPTLTRKKNLVALLKRRYYSCFIYFFQITSDKLRNLKSRKSRSACTFYRKVEECLYGVWKSRGVSVRSLEKSRSVCTLFGKVEECLYVLSKSRECLTLFRKLEECLYVLSKSRGVPTFFRNVEECLYVVSKIRGVSVRSFEKSRSVYVFFRKVEECVYVLSKSRGVSTFFSKSRGESLHSFEKSESHSPVMQRYIAEERKPHPHRCKTSELIRWNFGCLESNALLQQFKEYQVFKKDSRS